MAMLHTISPQDMREMERAFLDGTRYPSLLLMEHAAQAVVEALARYAAAGGYGVITFCGVCTDICVVTNALLVKTALPEADVRVAAYACAGVTPEKHRAAIETMRSCQIEII